MTVAQYYKGIATRLTSALGKNEGEAAARIIFEDVAGYDRNYIFMNGDREILDFMQAKIAAVTDRVVDGEPVQYAVGKARFMGNDFEVTPAVLIPRPETAGLVDMIVSAYDGRSDLRILDVGTGSGCIALSLARALPFAQVTGVDISADALKVAQDNAKALNVDARFMQLDILGAPAPSTPEYDIVVSNPPYICRSEAAEMERHVLDYEPHQALFVPDDNPLEFYKAICAYASKALVPGGTIWFEINSRFPDEMRSLLVNSGFDNVQIFRDYRGLYRYATATQPEK